MTKKLRVTGNNSFVESLTELLQDHIDNTYRVKLGRATFNTSDNSWKINVSIAPRTARDDKKGSGIRTIKGQYKDMLHGETGFSS